MLASLNGAVGHAVGQPVVESHFLETRAKGVTGVPHNGRTLLLVGVSGLNKTQAEDLLDWLEAHHYRYKKVSCQAADCFSVVYG